MKSIGIVFAMLFVLGSDSGIARAALRAPQIPVNGGSLQGLLNVQDGGINVLTDQLDAQHWTSPIAGNSTFTIQVELTGNPGPNSIGLYNGSSAAPALYLMFPGAASTGWFAVASFRNAPARVIVNLFDAAANLQGSIAYLGADKTDFGFYLQGPNGTFYSQDIRNPGREPRALAYAGTGLNAGSLWLALEDGPAGSADHDFDDALLFIEPAPNAILTPPVDVVRTTWSAVKARFR